MRGSASFPKLFSVLMQGLTSISILLCEERMTKLRTRGNLKVGDHRIDLGPTV